MSILRYERCHLCGGILATQAEEGPIHRYDEDHEHIEGAPSLTGRPILGGIDER
jgi:hypothetical protein